MVEYDKQCLRYRWFLLFKKIEKILPTLFNQIYLFDLINIKYNRSKLLIPNLEKINKN